MALPITLPGAWLTWPDQPITSAWLALGYVGVFSMWAGFFAWFRGLALGGALRVSQMQLLQPFFSIVAAVPLLGESLNMMTLGFALAVVATVFMGRRTHWRRRPRQQPRHPRAIIRAQGGLMTTTCCSPPACSPWSAPSRPGRTT